MCTHNENTNEIKERMNFIEQIVDNDLKEGKNDGRLQTRFPPETQRLSPHWSCEGNLYGLWRS